MNCICSVKLKHCPFHMIKIFSCGNIKIVTMLMRYAPIRKYVIAIPIWIYEFTIKGNIPNKYLINILNSKLCSLFRATRIDIMKDQK